MMRVGLCGRVKGGGMQNGRVVEGGSGAIQKHGDRAWVEGWNFGGVRDGRAVMRRG